MRNEAGLALGPRNTSGCTFQWMHDFPRGIQVRADLPGGQIAARVLTPGVSAELKGPDAGIAATDIQVRALTAAARDGPGPLFQSGHNRV